MTLFEDLRHAARALRAHKLLAATVAAILGIAIGANSAVFAVLNAVLLSPLPFPDADRLVAVTQTRSDSAIEPLSIPDYQDLRAGNRSFEGLGAAAQWSVNVTGGEPERLQGMKATATLFDVLGGRAALGRTIGPKDDSGGSPRVVVLTHNLWVRRFGGDASILGRAIILNGDAHTVVGVLPHGFILPVRDAELIAPFAMDADPRRTLRDSGFLRVIGRLGAGVTIAQARADLDAIMARLRAEHPTTNAEHLGASVVEWRGALAANRRSLVLMLQAAVVLVLIVACANVANLLLAAAIRREHEFAVRAALGASRLRLVRQVMLEMVFVAGGAAAFSLLVQAATAQSLGVLAPIDLLSLSPNRPTRAPLLAFTAATALFAVVGFGLVPAIRLGGSGATLRIGRAAAPASRRLRDALVSVEIAVASLLITIATLLSQSFARLQAVDPGFQAGHLLTARVSLPRARYPATSDSARFVEELRPRLLRLPGVEDAAAVNVVPLNGYRATADVWPADRPDPAPGSRPQAQYRMISPTYLRTFGVPLIAGRAFDEHDDASGESVVLVSRTLAQRFWTIAGAVGRPLTIHDAAAPRRARIVGVVGDVRHYGFDADPTADLYTPIPQVPDVTVQWLNNNMYWGVRAAANPAALRDAFKRALKEVDPDVPVAAVATMEQAIDSAMAPRRLNLWLVRSFAVLALLLSAAGVYAVTAFSVALRRRELAIRTALGAGQARNLRTILADTIRPLLRGLVLGAAGALIAGPALRSVLFEVDPLAAGTFSAVGAMLLAAGSAAALAAAWPIRRIHPVEALQVEAR